MRRFALVAGVVVGAFAVLTLMMKGCQAVGVAGALSFIGNQQDDFALALDPVFVACSEDGSRDLCAGALPHLERDALPVLSAGYRSLEVDDFCWRGDLATVHAVVLFDAEFEHFVGRLSRDEDGWKTESVEALGEQPFNGCE